VTPLGHLVYKNKFKKERNLIFIAMTGQVSLKIEESREAIFVPSKSIVLPPSQG
jgi:hypothetical protein